VAPLRHRSVMHGLLRQAMPPSVVDHATEARFFNRGQVYALSQPSPFDALSDSTLFSNISKTWWWREAACCKSTRSARYVDAQNPEPSDQPNAVPDHLPLSPAVGLQGAVM